MREKNGKQNKNGKQFKIHKNGNKKTAKNRDLKKKKTGK